MVCKSAYYFILSAVLTFFAGVGHWLVAYRKAEEQNYGRLHRRIKETYKNSRVADTAGKRLDGTFLVSH